MEDRDRRNKPKAARFAHFGEPPAAFPLQPSFSKLAVLSVRNGETRLQLKSVTLRMPPAASRLSVNRTSFRESTGALLAVSHRHCSGVQACSPDGHALLAAKAGSSHKLQLWYLPECR